MIPLLLVVATARANVNVDVCIQFVPDYEDADAEYEADDYLATNDPMTARGVHAKVIDVTTLPVVVANEWANDSGSYAGCLPTTLSLNPTHWYVVEVWSEVDVNDQTVRVYDDDASPALTTYTTSGFHPAAGTKWVYTPANTLWNTVLTSSFSMYRSTLGNATDELIVYAEGCPHGEENSGGCCNDDGVDTEDSVIYIDPIGVASSKYATAHEFGHCLLAHRTGVTGNADDSLTPGDCDGWVGVPEDYSGHYFVSEEYQSDAFWEGFAEYYSAAVFNNHSSQTDCSMYFYKAADWDNDDDDDESEDAQFLSCHGSALVHSDIGFYSRTGSDYFGTYCSSALEPNHAMEFDWIRFLWVMDVEHGMSPVEFADVYEEAHPPSDTSWESNDSGWTPGYYAGNPSWELEDAALDLSYSDWTSVADTYGVRR